ncbi:MAG: sarcosine oxidase subunit gamma family protein [Pseudomonadota bacterium]
MSDPVSALGGAVFEGPIVSIKDLGPVGMVTIRGEFASQSFASVIETVCGAPIPGIRRFEGGLGWMSPDELLWTGDYQAAPGIVAALSEALGSEHHLAVNVSDARAVFEVSGTGARELIAKGAPVDMSPEAFGPGDLRRTHIGQVAAAFWMGSESGETGFRLVCFRSYARYMFDWLRTSAKDGTTPGLF